jgi:hypothetical protein
MKLTTFLCITLVVCLPHITRVLATTNTTTSSSSRRQRGGNNGAPPLLQLSASERAEIAVKKATCPFIGSIVKSGKLPVYGTKWAPLAKVSDVQDLGNTGSGSSLGNVLALFANGNHELEPATEASTKLDKSTPVGYFSLDFGGSQGAHPGDSRILLSDWRKVNAGVFNEQAFARLLKHAENGMIKRSEIGKFIAHNLKRDPNSKIASGSLLLNIAKNGAKFIGSLFSSASKQVTTRDKNVQDAAKRDSAIHLTKVLGDQNLVGSSGEFGLMLALLEHSPKTREIDGEIAVSVDDVKIMFERHTMPAGWQSWKKTAGDWVAHSTKLAWHATKTYISL